MTKKNVQERSLLEWHRHSLAGRTVMSIIKGFLLMGLIAQLIGMSFYGTALAMQYIRHASDTASRASLTLSRDDDARMLAEKVMRIYRSLDGSQRSQFETDPDAYRAYYSDVNLSPNSNYGRLAIRLKRFTKDEDISSVYLGMYDQRTGKLVYIVDTDEEPYLPGHFETVRDREIRKFLNWDDSSVIYSIDNTPEYGWLCTVGNPIRDEEGDICAFVLVDVSINDVLSGIMKFALLTSGALLAAIVVITWFLNKYMQRTVVAPIDDIAKAAVAYVEDKQAGAKQTERFSGLNIHTGDELENLSQVMADMERDLSENEERITRITAEEQRIGTELQMASRIQNSMLPHDFPPFPDRREIDLYAEMDPAREVGGDFYDYFLIDDDHLCLVIADVSGKGIPAALFMMISKVILKSCAMLGAAPGEILTKTNEALSKDNQVRMFVTVWLGILELSTGRLTAANAGHEYPVLKRAGGAYELFKDKHGFVIGGMEGLKYKEYELQLQPGDKLFVYTDGLPESTDANEQMFGIQRMVDTLNQEPDADPEGVLKQIRTAVNGFVKDAEQFDDLTMMCLAYHGPAGEKPAAE